MRAALLICWSASAVGQEICHAISASATDDWCTRNCNSNPPNCPASLCQCDTPPPSPPGPPTPPAPVPGGPIFELDLFINDPDKGYQSTGFPDYLQHSAAKYTNVAGISFIQPSDLMNDNYDLPSEVGDAVRTLRKQGVAVQLLLGGQISSGWGQLQANPEKAAAKAIELMKKYDCGIEVDNEAGGDASGVIKFIQLCATGKPAGVHMSMDVGGTPGGDQVAVIQGAIDSLDWVNLMVSTPEYDQINSVNFGFKDGIPYEKMTVAYYAGTWVKNCNEIGSEGDTGSIAAGLKLYRDFGLKGLTIWAIGGASYGLCGTDDAPGFSQAMKELGLDATGNAMLV